MTLFKVLPFFLLSTASETLLGETVHDFICDKL